MEGNALISFDHLRAVLEDYGREVVEAYREELETRGKNASGKLSREVRFRVEAEDRAFEVTLTLPSYWANVEYGRPPCPPSKGWIPEGKLLEWIRVKPVIPYPDKNGRIPSPKSLAFLINRAINDPNRKGTDPPRPGIAPTPVMQSAVDRVNAKYDRLIMEAAAKDIEGYVATLTFADFSRKGAPGKKTVRWP